MKNKINDITTEYKNKIEKLNNKTRQEVETFIKHEIVNNLVRQECIENIFSEYRLLDIADTITSKIYYCWNVELTNEWYDEDIDDKGLIATPIIISVEYKYHHGVYEFMTIEDFIESIYKFFIDEEEEERYYHVIREDDQSGDMELYNDEDFDKLIENFYMEDADVKHNVEDETWEYHDEKFESLGELVLKYWYTLYSFDYRPESSLGKRISERDKKKEQVVE